MGPRARRRGEQRHDEVGADPLRQAVRQQAVAGPGREGRAAQDQAHLDVFRSLAVRGLPLPRHACGPHSSYRASREMAREQEASCTVAWQYVVLGSEPKRARAPGVVWYRSFLLTRVLLPQ